MHVNSIYIKEHLWSLFLYVYVTSNPNPNPNPNLNRNPNPNSNPNLYLLYVYVTLIIINACIILINQLTNHISYFDLFLLHEQLKHGALYMRFPCVYASPLLTWPLCVCVPWIALRVSSVETVYVTWLIHSIGIIDSQRRY